MAKTRPVKQPPRTSVKGQGSKAAAPTQQPNYQGGPPRERVNPPKAVMMNTSMTKPGSGTRGSNRGCR